MKIELEQKVEFFGMELDPAQIRNPQLLRIIKARLDPDKFRFNYTGVEANYYSGSRWDPDYWAGDTNPASIEPSQPIGNRKGRLLEALKKYS